MTASKTSDNYYAVKTRSYSKFDTPKWSEWPRAVQKWHKNGLFLSIISLIRHIRRNMLANMLNLLAFSWRTAAKRPIWSKINHSFISLGFKLILLWCRSAKNGIKRRNTQSFSDNAWCTSRGTHFVRHLLVSQLLSPTNAITSRLLGGEMFRFGLRPAAKIEMEKCSYIGQYLELRKILSCKIIRIDASCP